ncbi:MAG: hypothetical protein KFKLKKLM_01995 [Flavobacteriales bacterium]|nr:hypothetical protein [Flavobacteriales bacterium]
MFIPTITELVKIIGIEKFNKIPYTIKIKQPIELIILSLTMFFIKKEINTIADAIYPIISVIY